MQAPPDPVTPPESRLQCDLVMKGGITSGLVYPRAMARVARDYRIRSIGGTSIGAIAAVLTAAAEYWRQANPDDPAVRQQQADIDLLITALNTPLNGKRGWENPDRSDIKQAEDRLLAGRAEAPGFAGLYAIPDDIGSNLTGKFQPSPATTGAFRFLIAVLEARHPVSRIATILARQFQWFRIGTAFVLGLLTLAFVLDPNPALVALMVLVSAVLIFVAGRRVWAVVAPGEGQGSWSRRDPPSTTTPDTAEGLVTSPKTLAPDTRATSRLTWMLLGVTAVLLGLWGLYVQDVVGWSPILHWIGSHLPLTIGCLLLALLITQADVIRNRIIETFVRTDADSLERWRTRIDAVLLLVGVGLAALLIITNWTTFRKDETATAALVVGIAIGWVLGGFIGLGINAAVFIPHNVNGLCTGMGDRNALTPWLTRRINTVAGLDPEGPALTFGQLTGLPVGRQITLEAIATDLTRGVPLDLPHALRRYRFRPCDFRQFFPPAVLVQLGVTDPASDAHQPFPDVSAIPLVVVARMSMSFPVLFSAVPVYFNDGTTNAVDRRCLLSDGGIISNFPVHKFDRSLPGWPTFAIDLIEGIGDPPTDIDEQVWINPIRSYVGLAAANTPDMTPDDLQQTRELAKIAESEAQKMATQAISVAPADSLPGLLGRVVNTARGWMDNSQKALPGYRERIVGIRLYDGEGGLNLTMSASTIKTLAHRGMYGVHSFLEAWDPDPEPAHATETDAERRARSQWHQHRWLRYRIIMRSLENIGQEWRRRYAVAPFGGVHPSIADLVAQADDPEANGEPAGMAYHWQFGVNGGQAADLTAHFNAFAEATPDLVHPVTGELMPGYFDQPLAPEVEPKSLMMPPFE